MRAKPLPAVYASKGSPFKNFTTVYWVLDKWPKPYINHIGNYTKLGNDSYQAIPVSTAADIVLRDDDASDLDPDQGSVTPYAALYETGNLGVCSENHNCGGATWPVTGGYSGNILSTAWRSASAFDVSGSDHIPVSTTTTSDVYAQQMLKDLGATKPSLDSIDTRLIADFTAGTGSIKSTSSANDWPDLAAGAPSYPTDSDLDGISDVWESAQFGSFNQNQNTDFDGDGYSDLEAYLHELGGYGINSSTPEDPGATPGSNGGSSDGGCFFRVCMRTIHQ